MAPGRLGITQAVESEVISGRPYEKFFKATKRNMFLLIIEVSLVPPTTNKIHTITTTFLRELKKMVHRHEDQSIPASRLQGLINDWFAR